MNRLKLLREERGMKQSTLGNLLNVKDSAISKYESEKVPLTGDALIKLSEIFNVSADYILGLSDERFPVVDQGRGLPNGMPNYRDILFCGNFKQSVWNLCKNKHISLEQLEKNLGFSRGFVERVEKGLLKLQLEDVQKIAEYFHTTLDSVLDGGKRECRVKVHPGDDLLAEKQEACIQEYARLLKYKAMGYRKNDLFTEKISLLKASLERLEFDYMEFYKAHMDELEAKISTFQVAECEEGVLVNELKKRGYRIEKIGKEGGYDAEHNS